VLLRLAHLQQLGEPRRPVFVAPQQGLYVRLYSLLRAWIWGSGAK
jgi:hypothetical protein